MGSAQAPGATAVLQEMVDGLGELARDAKRAEADARRRARAARQIQTRLVEEAARLGFRLVITTGQSQEA